MPTGPRFIKLGYKDSNLEMTESESVIRTPIFLVKSILYRFYSPLSNKPFRTLYL